MHLHTRRLIALSASILGAIAVAEPVTALQPGQADVQVTFLVTNQLGEPLEPATVMACPVEAGSADCDTMVVAATNKHGLARLRFDADVDYDIVAFVRDPAPPWACPGTVFDGGEFYFSQNRFTGDPADVTKRTALIIEEPDPADCVPIAVTDRHGVALPTAGVIVCPSGSDSPCPNPSFEGPDADGLIRMSVDPALSYRLTAYVADAGWPCPSYVDASTGTPFHFSAEVEIVGADMIADTTTLVISRPTEHDCVPVHVTDQDGNPLPTAGLMICPDASDGAPCSSPSFDGPDPDGTIRITVDPTVRYQLTAYITDSGWPCPDYVDPTTGRTFHFSPPLDILGADLGAATTLQIRTPAPEECSVVGDEPTPVTVVEDT